MTRWAAERGLDFEDVGLLPAWSRTLAAGLGAGDHRAGLVIKRTKHTMTSVGGFKKRPERATHHICRGRLPGGLDGVVAHHLHLYLDSDPDGQSWKATPDTVVVARLPEGARVLCELRGEPVAPGAAIGRVVDLSDGSGPPLQPRSSEDRGGYRWTADPAEDPALLREVLGAGLDAAIAAAPAGTTVELRYGALCVSAEGAITDPAALDALCHVAAAVAAGVERAASLLSIEDPAAPLPAPRDDARARWIDAGVRRIAWPEPPASVPAAAAAYAQSVAAEAGVARRKTMMIAAPVALFLALLALAGTVIAGKLIGDPPLWTLAIVVVGAPFVVFHLLHGVHSMGREAATAHTALRATPWGIEAFAREYARSRGLTLEDRDAFRRGFDSPVAGMPLKVLGGEIADGLRGRLVLWLDPTDLSAKSYWLLAVVPSAGGPAPRPPAGAPYSADVRGRALVLSLEVPDAGRTATNLDALAAAAGLLSSQQALSSA
jgi:hypothetical protein